MGAILWGEVVADYELTFDEPAPLGQNRQHPIRAAPPGKCRPVQVFPNRSETTVAESVPPVVVCDGLWSSYRYAMIFFVFITKGLIAVALLAAGALTAGCSGSGSGTLKADCRLYAKLQRSPGLDETTTPHSAVLLDMARRLDVLATQMRTKKLAGQVRAIAADSRYLAATPPGKTDETRLDRMAKDLGAPGRTCKAAGITVPGPN